MIKSIQDAKSAFEADGLFTSLNNPTSILVGSSCAQAENGVRVCKDACALNRRGEQWVAVLPAEGMQVREITTTLSDAVTLILATYQKFREHGGEFKDICREIVNDRDRFSTKRTFAKV